jgi:exopolyphosphatase/guanosine-5'-triphosphate,3'-diphosphate pyrophosphatase
MLVAQSDSSGAIRTLEFLHQAVSLGKDTFSKGNITRSSIEECVKVLKSFRKVLEEYQINDEKRIRAVATTAVREASNIDAFIDRIAIATGITIEPIDETEVARLTYLSFRAQFSVQSTQTDQGLAKPDVIIAEVGGGSTELLYLQNGSVAFTNTYRVGTMRMHEMLHDFSAPVNRQREILQHHIAQTVANISKSITPAGKPCLIALGSDMRFAASNILDNYNQDQPARLSLKELSRFTEKIIGCSPNELVRKYHIPYPDAETVGQALMFYVSLARAFNVNHIQLTNISMRHGLLLELLGHNTWTDDFRRQISSSAIEIAKKYKADISHARHVANLCDTLFDALASEHRLDQRWKHLLNTAALLHDIGTFVSSRSHHKHSMYLIQNSELFGIGRKDLLLVSLIARYHRRSVPKPDHPDYSTMERRDRQSVVKLASVLRIADALDRSFNQRIDNITCSIDGARFVITAPVDQDLSLEQLALKNKGTMFDDAYGLNVILRAST